MTEKEKMLNGELYLAQDKELGEMSLKCRSLLDRFNETKFGEYEKRSEIIKELFGKIGKNVNVNKPFFCDYGAHIEVGDNFYANFDCLILDVNKVIIGNNVFFAPRVNIYTAGHPIDKDVRNTQLEFGKKVVIGDDVWVGGNVVINPGVTIGSNVVIGSGSVVTKDIPSGVIAVGNPCKVIRKITEEDKKYWNLKKDEYYLTK
ncbi:sugar O-acetyltransferase [Haploplasma axanthum]|uniref:sugar O-acetyltransferase n=1 Tax=Haploplasma axanthum TaxID=29552 RepID=UPI000479D8CC